MFLHLIFIFAISGFGIESSAESMHHNLFPSIPAKKRDEYKPLSLKVACTNNIIMGIVTLQRPFYGALYARNFPDGVCKIEGNGTKELRLAIPTFLCGTQLINNTDGSMEFEVYLYLQYDKKLQQAYDELLHLRCFPTQTTTIKSQMIHRKDVKMVDEESKIKPNQSSTIPDYSVNLSEPNSNFTDSFRRIISNPAMFDSPTNDDIPLLMEEIDPKMTLFVFDEKVSGTEPVLRTVNVGDIITMKITFKHPRDIDSKIVDCFANDGEKDVHQLLNSNGCTLNEDIMPNMNETYNAFTCTKTATTTFRAFKIPSLNYVYIKCRIRMCVERCNLNCSKLSIRPSENRFKRGKAEFEEIAEENVSFSEDETRFSKNQIWNEDQNKTFSFEIKSKLSVKDDMLPYFVNSGSSAASYSADFITSVTKKDECLTSTRVIILISLLLSFLIISLVVTICMCVKSRELSRRLLERRVIPFVKVPQYSP